VARPIAHDDTPGTQGVVAAGWLVTLLGAAVVGSATGLPVELAVPLGVVGAGAGIALLAFTRVRPGPGTGYGTAGLVLSVVGLLLSAGLTLVPGAAPRGSISDAGPAFDIAGSSPPPPVRPQAPVRLEPAQVNASSTAAPSVDSVGNPVTFDATNVADGDPSTAWRTAGDGVGATLQVTFGAPVHLDQIGMVVGYAKTDPYDGSDRFIQNGRVNTAQFAFDDGRSYNVAFTDARDLQTFEIDADTQSVTVRVVSSVPGSRDYTAIGEIAFIGSER
jgi:hypothetical protein